MRCYGTLLQALNPVELPMDPGVPDVPRHLLFLAHAIELAFRDLSNRVRKAILDGRLKKEFIFGLTVKTAASLSSS